MPKYTIVLSPGRKSSGREQEPEGAVAFNVGAMLGRPELENQKAIVLFTSLARARDFLEDSGLGDTGGWMAQFDPEEARGKGEYHHIEGTLGTAGYVVVDPPIPPSIPMDVTPVAVEDFLASFR